MSMDNPLWSNLPSEIIAANVLPRLPFKTLCRFKCVSPSWNSLISSPSFPKNHYPLKAILFSSSYDLYSVDFADANPTAIKLDAPPFTYRGGWVRSLSSCNGLVLVSYNGFVNFLLNPSSNEYKQLPLPDPPFPESMNEFIYPVGLGFDSSTDDYKVVMFCYKAETTTVHVYSLKTGAWRTIRNFDYTPEGHRRGVCFNERLHWLCWKRTGGLDDSKVIFAFDLANEVFGEMQLPASYDDNEFRGHDMMVLEGCLCLLIYSRERIDVWMMMEYGVRESWTRFTLANPATTRVDTLCLSAQDELVLRKENWRIRGVVDEFDREKLLLYNPIQGTIREKLVSGIPTKDIVGTNYMENLVSPNNEERIRTQGEA